MSSETASKPAPQFVVRLPDEAFRERISASAKKNKRSMNSEIVSRLQQTFDMQEPRINNAANTILGMIISGVPALYKALPEELKTDRYFQQLNALAKALHEEDPAALSDGLALLFDDDPEYQERFRKQASSIRANRAQIGVIERSGGD